MDPERCLLVTVWLHLPWPAGTAPGGTAPGTVPAMGGMVSGRHGSGAAPAGRLMRAGRYGASYRRHGSGRRAGGGREKMVPAEWCRERCSLSAARYSEARYRHGIGRRAGGGVHEIKLRIIFLRDWFVVFYGCVSLRRSLMTASILSSSRSGLFHQFLLHILAMFHPLLSKNFCLITSRSLTLFAE